MPSQHSDFISKSGKDSQVCAEPVPGRPEKISLRIQSYRPQAGSTSGGGKLIGTYVPYSARVLMLPTDSVGANSGKQNKKGTGTEKKKLRNQPDRPTKSFLRSKPVQEGTEGKLNKEDVESTAYIWIKRSAILRYDLMFNK